MSHSPHVQIRVRKKKKMKGRRWSASGGKGWCMNSNRGALRRPVCQQTDVLQTVIKQETEAYFLLNLYFTLMPCSAEKKKKKIKG